MILSSCHDYSLNNDRHCHCCCHCHCHYMQRIYVYFISPCLFCLALSWVDYYYYCYYRHDVVWARLTLPYHIISYLMFFYFISSADLFFILFHLILFYSILLYFKLIRFDLIWIYSTLFYWIWFTILFSIVSHMNEWFVSICLSVCPSVCLSVWISLCFFFTLFLFLYSFLFSSLFYYSFFTLFSHERLPHTHTDTHTHIHMNICSFLWLVHISSIAGKWEIVFEW